MNRWKVMAKDRTSDKTTFFVLLIAVSHGSQWLLLVQRREIAHSNHRDVIDQVILLF